MGAGTCRKLLNFRHVNRYSEDRTSRVTSNKGMALGRWKRLGHSQRLIATASYQKAKRSDRDPTLTLTLAEALLCTKRSRRFNQLRYVRFLASSSRPNIIGSFDANKGFIVDYTTGSSGAIKSHRVVQQDWNGTGSGGSNTGSGFDFNASWSNSIFGSANSVQVNSIRMLPCIKI